MDASATELLGSMVQRVRGALAEELRARDARELGLAAAPRLPTSSQLIAHIVNGAGLRPIAHDRMSRKSFNNLLRGRGGSRVLGQLGDLLAQLVTGTLELERHERGDEIGEAVLQLLDQALDRYDALVETLAACDVPEEQLARAILRALLPDLAIRRAAILHLTGQEVSRAPITERRPMNAMLHLLWREADMHRGAMVRVNVADPEDPKNGGVPSRTLADWQAGALPRRDQIERAAAEIVTRARAREKKDWTVKQVRGWLRMARAAQYVRTRLEKALGASVVADLLEAYEELTRLAFDVLGSDELERATLDSIARIDPEELLQQMEARAPSSPTTKARLEEARAAGVSDPVAFVFAVGHALLEHEATREEGRQLLRETALQGALMGTSGVMGPWLCTSMARRTTSPTVAAVLRSSCLRDWREVVLDLAAKLVVVRSAANVDPALRPKADAIADRMLGFAA